MGLDARVPCRCWVDGLTTEPPIDRSLLGYEEGYVYAVKLADDDIDEFWNRADLVGYWSQTCCPHPGLEYCREWVGNWPSVRLFTTYVNLCDDGQFTVLRDIMPSVNGGEVSPVVSAAALAECEAFIEAVTGKSAYFLVDADTGKELYQHIPVYSGFPYGVPDTSGFDMDGVFVVEDQVEVFRAARARQQYQMNPAGDGWVMTLTSDDGSTYARVTRHRSEDRTWEVRCRRLRAEDIPCINALKRLFRACVEINMPVCWC
ncbi:MAG: hypothetical protein FWG47_03290 [Propionibacteriaceae bacterium]|nr:hypothetical protein [Propionibacteriaceae bacterium]